MKTQIQAPSDGSSWAEAGLGEIRYFLLRLKGAESRLALWIQEEWKEFQ